MQNDKDAADLPRCLVALELNWSFTPCNDPYLVLTVWVVEWCEFWDLEDLIKVPLAPSKMSSNVTKSQWRDRRLEEGQPGTTHSTMSKASSLTILTKFPLFPSFRAAVLIVPVLWLSSGFFKGYTLASSFPASTKYTRTYLFTEQFKCYYTHVPLRYYRLLDAYTLYCGTLSYNKDTAQMTITAY